MVPEAPLEQTDEGLVPAGEGWFVLNARDARWDHTEGRSAICDFEGGGAHFAQLGFNIGVLGPGQPMAMYHWEADQEDFLVVSGEAVLIVEGEERPLKAWDFVHCPVNTKHVIIGAGDGPCVVISVGSREHQNGPGWGAYAVDEVAARHGASVEQDTTDSSEAYAGLTRRKPTRFRDDWLPAA